MVDIYITLATKIIKEQEAVIGPLAWSEASKVKGLTVKDHDIDLKGEGKSILEALVNQYSTLFGQASIEVCKDAVRKLAATMDKNTLPAILS